MSSRTVAIACPVCQRTQKTRNASEWCYCAANALWFRSVAEADADHRRLMRDGEFAYKIVPVAVGAWRTPEHRR